MRTALLTLWCILGCAPKEDPVCAQAAERETAIESQLIRVRGDLAELQTLAREVAEHTPIRPATVACPPAPVCQDAAALARADACIRDEVELKARVRDAIEAWRSPNEDYNTFIGKLESLEGTVK